MKYDFSGWATRNDLRCSDGRTIRKNAFIENDGQVVPLVWNHQHNAAGNVLGHALLENRPEGVYTYGVFNDTEAGRNAKELVKHGDVTHLSIYANKLKQNGGDVLHGTIREVSLVLAGANPGAYIDSIISHGEVSDEEAIIYTDEGLFLSHADSETEQQEEDGEKKETSDDEETIQDVFDTLTEKQKKVVYAMIGMAIENEKVEHSEETDMAKDYINHAEDEKEETSGEETIQDVFDTLSEKQKQAVYALIGMAMENKDEGDDEEDMKHNVFESDYENGDYLTHSEMEAILSDAKRYGSLKESVLQHGITNIERLFPEDKAVSNVPEWVKRDDEWVTDVMNNVKHTPFARVKSMYANITADEARAKGYMKPNEKTEEVFPVFKRSTPPQTVYKKQKLDRDDVIDIIDFDVVAWLKTEMRSMLNEELARAFLIGDGRSPSSDDKIDPLHIRPIWGDDNHYTIQKSVTVAANATDDQISKAFIRAAVKSRKDYKGTGNPTLYTTEDVLTDLLLMEDNQGRVIYETVDKLCSALRVKKIVTVPVMENQTRTEDSTTYTLMGIIVNLNDYVVGADKGGAVSMFDDFDIDYNAQKYLIETRCSGALVKPYSAIALEKVVSA